jgi:hypothetical protein
MPSGWQAGPEEALANFNTLDEIVFHYMAHN